jgi:ABC transporter with metal-binding/Fe-S-binding domain ATP-binding protein
MNLGVLFSGGKDSSYALYKAMKHDKITCLISLLSKNDESYMFHTPNITLTNLQAEAMKIPLIQQTTAGEKEKELEDLTNAIKTAKNDFNIEGIVTGAVGSIYQAARIQSICKSLDLWCFNPLWMMDQVDLLKRVFELRFQVIISGVFAYPFDKNWLGREINTETINDLITLQKKFQINPAGEGGELETTVLDAPFFKKRIEIEDFDVIIEEYSGRYQIKKARLVEK